MLKLKDFKKFKVSKLSKAGLASISGGTPTETNTCKGTTKIVIGGGIADSAEDGDWYPDC